MEKEIKERYNDTILAEARKRFGIAEEKIKLLDGFESFMYEFEKGGEEFILRIGHSRRRTANLISAEADYINYLADGGATVARAIMSNNEQLVESINDQRGGYFLATAFEKAPGSPVWETGFWQRDDLWEAYGRLIGRMHALSKDYQPSNPTWKRTEWDNAANIDHEKWLPADQSLVGQRLEDLLVYLRALPMDVNSYGLIHQDAHAGNFFVDDQGTITLFDFDDCVYGWYVYDLAMVLFYAITNRDDISEFGPRFWGRFMHGYRQENYLEQSWMQEIPHFLKLREIDLYVIIHRSFDLDDLAKDGWVMKFMDGRRERIESDTPYVNWDIFSTI